MSSLLGEQLFEINGQGPPPENDYFQLVISKTQVIFISWTISLRRGRWGAPPKEGKLSHEDFQQDKRLQQTIAAVFGQRILDYTLMICDGVFDYLERLPEDILLKITSYLNLKDVGRLAQVSKRFREFCNSERFWEIQVRAAPEFTSDMEQVCSVVGWRKTFMIYSESWMENN